MLGDIIVLSGKKGSGKTTIAAELALRMKERDKIVMRFALADPIYDIHNYALKKIGYPVAKDRALLIKLGDWGREKDPLIWVQSTRRSVESFVRAYQNSVAIVTDCRFRNEFEAFPEALRVRLDCPSAIRKERCSAWDDDKEHDASETDLDAYAEDGKFDLSLNTFSSSVDHCATMILAQLDKRVWLEKRVPYQSVWSAHDTE